jgi:hypothetical protein
MDGLVGGQFSPIISNIDGLHYEAANRLGPIRNVSLVAAPIVKMADQGIVNDELEPNLFSFDMEWNRAPDAPWRALPSVNCPDRRTHSKVGSVDADIKPLAAKVMIPKLPMRHSLDVRGIAGHSHAHYRKVCRDFHADVTRSPGRVHGEADLYTRSRR